MNANKIEKKDVIKLSIVTAVTATMLVIHTHKKNVRQKFKAFANDPEAVNEFLDRRSDDVIFWKIVGKEKE